ncbi:hypothetical protein Hamer_G024354 [Homarus americanus]|uniref:Uncharacterized protein n=1 Tax=Homarus americanus TaxID=6706 RepID=A0A8J5T464_HOMAM|nr:hypothetical protein Hamer_G024354 [Homarus americanus]
MYSIYKDGLDRMCEWNWVERLLEE